MPEQPPLSAPPPGLYEQVITDELASRLQLVTAPLRVFDEEIDSGESHSVLAQHLERTLEAALSRFPDPERSSEQVKLCNVLLQRLNESRDEQISTIAETARRLLAVLPIEHYSEVQRPDTPLSTGCLLTGSRLDVSLVSQLRKEIATSDRIDILCSFIKWSGVRVIDKDLQAFAERSGTALRVITTSYLGATELKAIEFLERLPNTGLQVSYDTRRTRLHAKAYLFHRETGFGSAYVGSANLSQAALTDGLEWNVKISQFESPHLWEKLTATFDLLERSGVCAISR